MYFRTVLSSSAVRFELVGLHDLTCVLVWFCGVAAVGRCCGGLI